MKPLISGESYQRPVTLFYPGLRQQALYDQRELEWVHGLRGSVETIRNELTSILAKRQGFEPVFPGYADQGSWAAFWFQLYGDRYNENCALAPRTTALIEAVPRLAGWACFSAIAPGSHVRTHCGVTNAKLRVHLAVRAEPGSRMRVGDTFYEWTEGDAMVFDDSYEHEVWVGGRAPRIVLILDVYHPDLTPEEVEFMHALETRPTALCPNGLRGRYQRITTLTRERSAHASLDWLYDPSAIPETVSEERR